MASEPDVLADRYRLTDSIGRGGMADVYAAEDTSSGRMVAVKIMRMGEQADPDRFAAEMEILDRLSHPAVVRLFDSGTTDDACPYFVMQLVDGLSLSARLRADGPLDAEDAADIGARVASALAHAHSMGVIHRDIKPANILIDGDGGAYLSDFGVARLADATLVTRAGTTIGTAAYLAPEQLQDSQVGPGADVYAFGLVMLEALTGRRAFGGTGIEAAMARLSRDPSIPRTLPEPWVQLLVTMTRRAVDRRPGADEVEEILRGQREVPETSVEELGARTYDPASGDDDATAITEPGDTGSQSSSSWGPPRGSSGPTTVPPVPESTSDPEVIAASMVPAITPADPVSAAAEPVAVLADPVHDADQSPAEVGAPAPDDQVVPAVSLSTVDSGMVAAVPTEPPEAAAPVVVAAPVATHGVGPAPDEAGVDPAAVTAGSEVSAPPATAMPAPTPALGIPAAAAGVGVDPAIDETGVDAARRGWDSIRSRALYVGLLLGAIGVIVTLSIATLFMAVEDPMTVQGSDPVDEAAREVLGVLDASERLSAADPSLQRDLVSLSEGIVQAVNEDTWDVALIGVIDMTQEARSAITDLDIDSVALDGLLSALRDLAIEIEAAAAAEVDPADS